MMHNLLVIGICIFLFPGLNDTSIINENFDYPDGNMPGCFWSEGCTASIRNHRLLIEADITAPRASSVWLDRKLSGDLRVEFDVYLLSSSDDANNINVFFMYNDPSGIPLRQTAAERQNGLYKQYHDLDGYIFTNVTNGDTSHIRYRFRKNPGFQLISEKKEARKHRKKKIHIVIFKKGNRFEYWEDNTKVFDVADDGINNEYNSGLFGFRTWHTTLEIDNLVIARI